MNLPRDIVDLIERLKAVAERHGIRRLAVVVEEMDELPEEQCGTFKIELPRVTKTWGEGRHFVFDEHWQNSVEESLTKEIKESIGKEQRTVQHHNADMLKSKEKSESAKARSESFLNMIPDLITELGNITKDKS